MNNEMGRATGPSLTERIDVDVELKDSGPTEDSSQCASNDQAALDLIGKQTSVPLFLRDIRNGDQGNAQDEKDSTEE